MPEMLECFALPVQLRLAIGEVSLLGKADPSMLTSVGEVPQEALESPV